MIRRYLKSLGWWLASGAIERIKSEPDLVKTLLGSEDLLSGRLESKLDRLIDLLSEVKTNGWLQKEYQAIAFEDQLLAAERQRFGPDLVAEANTHLFSQTYEDAAIAAIFHRIGPRSNTFIEFGVGDGSENTTRLLLMLGWRGLWIESNRDDVATITRRFARELEQGRLILHHLMATTANSMEPIDASQLGDEVDLLSIDIDQNSSHLWRSLSVRSRVTCIEYNAHFPPSVEYEIPYNEFGRWDGSNLFGASLKTLELIGREKAMSLVGCDLMGVNAYFVADDWVEGRFSRPFTAEHHYQPPRYPLVRGQRGHRRS